MELNRKKTCSIALMSGKGGSGKTTLALSMASLLSSCDVKTLLVDCDISTNGATYFFEDEMAYHANHIDTLHELLISQKDSMDIQRYPVNEFFDFLPSVTKIGEVWTVITLNKEREAYLENLLNSISEKYDVVIYDCQAGYTQILETVIRMTDRNLMVLEADSISASAVRNLFLKLNKVWDNKRIYQVFNKATKEEAEIYSKVTSGTMFDNIGCILFDWTVRRAFSVSKIPDMIHTSANYGMQVCELCDALIKNPRITKKLDSYVQKKKLDELKSLMNDLREKESKKRLEVAELESMNTPIVKIIEFLGESGKDFSGLLYAGIIITTACLFMISLLYEKFYQDFEQSFITVMFIYAIVTANVAGFAIVLQLNKKEDTDGDELLVLKKELKLIEENMKDVQSKISTIENSHRDNEG